MGTARNLSFGLAPHTWGQRDPGAVAHTTNGPWAALKAVVGTTFLGAWFRSRSGPAEPPKPRNKHPQPEDQKPHQVVLNETTISGSNFTEVVSIDTTKRCQIRPPQP